MDNKPVTQQKKHWPRIVFARPLRRYQFGSHHALLLDEIQADGLVQYLYVLEVYDPTRRRCFAVASEKNSFPKPGAPPSYFLGVFHGDVHENLGLSEEWGDLETFTERALKIVCEKLDVEKAVRLE